MQTAEKLEPTAFDRFILDNAKKVLDLAVASGFKFEVRDLSGNVLVKCEIPGKKTRYINFSDHRDCTVPGHGTEPHVCNNWLKDNKPPFGWDFGRKLSSARELDAMKSAAVMCMTQTGGYTDLKEGIFTEEE